MRIKVFQSDKGDCLLLTGKDGTRILADGGMATSYTEHVAPALGRLRSAGQGLDLVYLSHIDQDHIQGILQLLDDHVAWRVWDYQQESGNLDYRPPAPPRPPEIARIWHNAFEDQVDKNVGDIERMLAASASLLASGSGRAELDEAEARRGLAASVSEGIELSRRVGAEQLGIPVNGEFGRKLIQVRDQDNTVELGALKLTVVGPFKAQLEDLRDDWDKWLREYPEQLERVRRRMREDAERLAAGEVEHFFGRLEQRAGELGNIAKVTVPNLASLMLLVEEDHKTILMTGDGHPEQILAGLERAGRLEADGLHLNVLKVQHHGSEHNVDPDFFQRITADTYIFCANGAYMNPDLRGLDALFDSRLGPKSRRSRNPGAERAFTVRFNSSSTATAEGRNKRHMRAVETLVGSRAKRSDGRLRHSFLDKHAFELRL